VLAGIDDRAADTIYGRSAAWIDPGQTHDRVSQHDSKILHLSSVPQSNVAWNLRATRRVHVIASWEKKLQRMWLVS